MNIKPTATRSLLYLSLAALLAACGTEEEQSAGAGDAGESTPSRAEVAGAMLDSLGGEQALRGVELLVLEGSGERYYLDREPPPGEQPAPAQLPRLKEVIDLENGRAAYDNAVTNSGGFQQERTEVLTSYQGEPLAWGTTEGRPNHVTTVDGLFSWATHHTPALLLRRNVITMALTAADIDGDQPATEAELEGEAHWLLETDLDGEEVQLYVDQDDYRLAGWEVLDTEIMRGDKQALYLLDDYREVEGLNLPFSLRIEHGGEPFVNVQYEDIRVNDQQELALFEMPPEVEDQARAAVEADGSWVSLQWNEVADGVVHIVAFSHHSMVVEFSDFVVVVEAPYTAGQSLTLAAMIEERIGKPIRYVVPTHPHWDHTGGLRAMVAQGADVMVTAAHEADFRTIVESTHSNPPDVLARRREEGAEVGQIELFEDMSEISDGSRTLQLHAIDTVAHIEPMVIALDTQTGSLFQSDLFFGAPGRDASGLYQAIQDLGLQVEQIVGGHAGPFPIAQLEQAAQAEAGGN